MSDAVKALLVFCEGPHDVAYVSQVLKHCLELKALKAERNWALNDFPSPFNQVFRTSLTRHVGTLDLQLDQVHKFFLPDKVFSDGKQVVLLFNTGGDSKIGKIRDLLKELLPMLSRAKQFKGGAKRYVSEARYLFLYDADEHGAETIRKEVYSELKEVEGQAWFLDDWVVEENNAFAARSGDKAIYIWGAQPEKGTLEDLLHPLFAQDNADLVAQAESHVDLFDWGSSVAGAAKRKKAIITIAGQHKKPGCSMQVVLDQAGLIKSNTWNSSAPVSGFVRFIADFAALGRDGDAGLN